MAKRVLLIEDDPAVRDRLRYSLQSRSLEVTAVGKIREAVEQLRKPGAIWDAVILDLKLDQRPAGHPELTGYSEFKPNGYALARLVREEFPDVPVFGFSNFPDEIDATGREWFQESACPSRPFGIYAKQQQWVLLRHHVRIMTGQPAPVRVFIVHGHDHGTRDELVRYVRGLKWDADVLGEGQSKSRTWIERFEKQADQAALAWVLFTADEWAMPTAKEKKPELRTRPNVLLECGYFLGAFGRLSDRVLLFKKGDVVLPSDLDGVGQILLNGSVQDADGDIRRELSPWF